MDKEETCICEYYSLERGDTLYVSADWDGGIGFDYIRDIRFCPVCGKELPEERLQFGDNKQKIQSP